MYFFNSVSLCTTPIFYLFLKTFCLQAYLALSPVMGLAIENCKAYITAGSNGPFGLNSS